MIENNSYRKAKKKIVFYAEQEDLTFSIENMHTCVFDSTILRTPSPNVSGIFLNLADREIESAFLIFNNLIVPALKVKGEVDLRDKEAEFFDYIEHIQLAIISLYTSIESLTNSLIPWDILYSEASKGGIISMDRFYIERNKSTEEKLSKILPEALGFESPVKSTHWTSFKKLQDLRNNIIHAKSASILEADHEKNLLYLLLNKSVFETLGNTRKLLLEITDQVFANSELPIIKPDDKELHLVFEDIDLATEYLQAKGILPQDEVEENNIANDGPDENPPLFKTSARIKRIK